MNASASLLSRGLVITLALLALLATWIYMANVAGTSPWYRHAEANLPTLTDSLALNNGVAPARIAEPGLLSSYLLALDLRIRHGLHRLPVWNISTLGASTSPLHELQALVRLEQMHSRILIILLILGGGALACSVVPGLESGCLTVVLLCGCAGLLYHGLTVQPELLSCGLGVVLALLCAWHGTNATNWRDHHGGLFLAGLFGGFAALVQTFGVIHLFAIYAWCWLAACSVPALRPGRPGIRVGLLPVASAILLLWFAQRVSGTGATNEVIAERLRAMSLLVGLIPLVTLWSGANRRGAFLRERASEFALLCGGALAALTLAYATLRTILPADAALVCWADQLEHVFYPGQFTVNILTAPAGIVREILRFIRASPFLYVSAIALAFTICQQRDIPVRTKAFIVLLLATALGQTWQLAHSSFTESASVGVQVPLILVCAIAVLSAGPWPHRSGRRPWLAPVILVVAAVLLVTAPLRLHVNSPPEPSGDKSMVSGYTLTYLFDQHDHPPAYRQMMQDHYGNRVDFERAAQEYLAQPGHRY
jgi:hypothetical protein